MLNILVNVVMIIVGVFLVLGILAVRGTFYIWLFFLSVFTLTLQLTDNIEIIGSILLWVAILIGLIFSQKNIRQQLVSQNILKYFKKKLPDVGNIEKAMVVSGHKWFEGNILNGNLNWDLLLQWPNPELTAREQIFLGNQVDTLCGMLNDWDLTQSKSDLSPQIWVYLKQHKFLSMLIPQEYGGLGFSSFAISEIVQKIATRSVTAAINIMVPNSLGPHELLLKYGTKLQKEEYLPQLAAGYHVPAFAVTSDVEDSDPALMSDNGIVCYGKYQDQEVLGILLNWDKSYVTLAPIATLLCLVVKLYDPNNLLVGSHKELGFTVCLIPTNLPGITHNTKYLPLNQVCMSGPIRGKNVFLPSKQTWKKLPEALA